MKRFLSATACVLAAFASAFAETPVMPFADVLAGMQGTGRTVFHGTTIESFDVEILGKLPNIGPGQNLILARCSGGPLAETGIMAGMSGSPVMIDGKLIGAVAYSWGFSKDAIAGITPIEEMLAIASRSSGERSRRSGSFTIDRDALQPLYAPGQVHDFFAARMNKLFTRSGALLPTAIPLSISGMNPQGLSRVMPDLRRAGFLPMQGGSSGAAVALSPPLEPGSAMGLKLVRGAVEMTATGTVTWVDGDRILAFGHPMFGLGSVDLPLTGASVEALLPSLSQSTKMATALSEVGALREDRAAGIYGRIGAEPRMIPVRLQLTSANGEETFSFDVADDPLLSPLLLYSALNGILASKERAFGNATISLGSGSIIKMLDGDDVELDNLYAGPQAFAYGTGIAAYILQLLMNNTWTQPRIAGINLMLEFDEVPRTARIRRATLNRYQVAPGETVIATAVLRPYRGPDVVVTREIVIPPETAAGPLSIYIGGAVAAGRAERSETPPLPQTLSQLVRLINQLRRNDRVYILATREDDGVVLDGSRLPNLPPSAARVLSRPKSQGNLSVVRHRGIFEEDIATDYAVQGFSRLLLEVTER